MRRLSSGPMLRQFVVAAALVLGTAGIEAGIGQVAAQQTQSAAVAAVLKQDPADMVAQLRELAVADPAVLPVIMALLPSTTKAQRTAIGTALGQAAKIVVRTNQAYANQIQFFINQTKDDDVMKAYAAVVGDRELGVVGGGAGGGGGGGGGGGPTNPLQAGTLTPGTLQPIGSSSFPTSSFTITSSVSGASAPPPGTTTLTQSVSP